LATLTGPVTESSLEYTDADWGVFAHGGNIAGDPLFKKTLSGTDLACSDHVVTGGYTVTSATGAFYSGMVGKGLMVTDTGTGGHFVVGAYVVNSYVSATEITLTTDPTDGTNDVAGDYHHYDFTPKHGSPLLGAGFPPYFYMAGESDPAVTNYGHIGAVTRKEPHTTLINGGLVS